MGRGCRSRLDWLCPIPQCVIMTLHMKIPIVKFLTTCIILTLSLSLLSGCIYTDNPSPTTPSPSPSNPVVPPNPEYTLPPPIDNPPLPDFASVVAKVKPSVVAINTEVVSFDIFNRPFTQEGAGSGWIVDGEGHIVTNNHVITGAESITASLVDGRTFAASVVGADILSDIAVLKVDAIGLPVADIGDSSELVIGEWVLAIGNALGLGITAKEGIISRISVSAPVPVGQALYDLIETSAAINPGNSGGPLVKMSGEVIGITSAKLTSVEVEGLGYAISSNTASPIIEELIQKGFVVRPWLGVSLGTVNELLVMRYNLAVDKGAFIGEVVTNGPADKAGLRTGDVIVKADGVEIATSEDLIRVLHAGNIGQELEMTYWRENTQNTAVAVLVKRPAS